MIPLIVNCWEEPYFNEKEMKSCLLGKLEWEFAYLWITYYCQVYPEMDEIKKAKEVNPLAFFHCKKNIFP